MLYCAETTLLYNIIPEKKTHFYNISKIFSAMCFHCNLQRMDKTNIAYILATWLTTPGGPPTLV
jgi:hypothetical protein